MMWQLYWPNWWKLWPHYNRTPDRDYPVNHNLFCIGPLQIRWYSKGTL